MTWDELSRQLAHPFPASAISWRAGSVSRDKKRAQALPYAEPRVYEDRLNEVLGPDWSCKFTVWGEQRIICDLTITVDGAQITRSSTGEFDSGDKIAQGTVAEAQAFKRACVKFGLGRYLYDLPVTWVAYDESNRRLVETPRLPDRFDGAVAPPELPKQAPRANTQVKPAEAETGALEPRLSAKRAAAMSRELEKLGHAPAQQLQMSVIFLDKPIKSLEELTESEALQIWNEARKLPRKDEPPFDADPPIQDFDPHKRQAPTLSNQKASELHKALGIFGCKDHMVFVHEVIGREVESFTELTIAESVKVYEAAVEKYGSDEQKAEYARRKAA